MNNMAIPGKDIIHDAIKAQWTIEKIGGVLAVAIIIVIILLISAQAWTNKKLVNSFHETNKELLSSNKEIAKENQKQMAKLTMAVNKLTLETRTDITVLKEKVDGLEDTIRDRQMMP
ncbi:hypothetical protein SAMN02910293_00410 [Streptococcus henryi]|uniref:Uncharacterized protein n=1 Tax=Streptococcus henryi TaxID=439219 RepID=A0A1G6AJD1_9STRE|nr:hypothetical protein [Streptococcus henryi]QBX25309.1 hypothetical protein Javan252_0008 [Streptococcus phage Javan252]SDB08517.1 hypothetical protein SAMN02910293_00410 [Streptococcus henryi]